jgi:5-methylcytosine-specific restriction endonuclease McrA
MKLRTFGRDFRRRVSRSKKDRRRFYDKNGRRCWYCGDGVPKKEFILEHQQPFSKGGSCKLKDNIVLSCVRCDSEKASKTVEQYRNYLFAALGQPVEFFGESGRRLKRSETV